MIIITRPMTPRRWALLKAIAEHIDAHGYAPSLRELQDYCNISSTSVVSANLRRLEDTGLIQREVFTIARSIRLTELGREALRRGE